MINKAAGEASRYTASDGHAECCKLNHIGQPLALDRQSTGLTFQYTCVLPMVYFLTVGTPANCTGADVFGLLTVACRPALHCLVCATCNYAEETWQQSTERE